MTDFTDSHRPSTTAGPFPAVMLKKTFDCAATNKSANQVDNAFNVYPGDVVLNVSAQVETAEGGTLTFDVGDGDDVDGYIDGANGNSAAWNTELHAATGVAATAATNSTQAVAVTFTGYTGTKIYTTTDTIDVKFLNAADAAKITLRAVIIRGT